MEQNNKNNDGFSMLEVVISLGLLVMIIGLMPLVTVIQNSNLYSADSTSMTNLAMTLSETLGNVGFSTLGSDTSGSCVDSTGQVINGTLGKVCIEGPLNQLGYTNLENSSDDVYMFYRYSVVCGNTTNLPGGYTGDVCSLPTSNYVGGPVVDDLNCTASSYTNISKEIKIVVAYRDKKGKCKKTTLKSWKINYD